LEEILITAKKRQKAKVIPGSSSSLLSVIDFFVQAIGVISLFSVTAWMLTGSPARSETSDKLTYIAAGTGVLLFGLVALKKSIPISIQKFLTYTAYVSILVGIAIVEHKAMSQEHPMGFGWGVLVLTLALLPLVYYVVSNQKLNRIVVVLLWVPAIFVVFCDVLAFWQTRTTLIESAHSEYVINEILPKLIANQLLLQSH
jgi:peptidoglycan/LPS O-acetylase OafA/YrhL